MNTSLVAALLALAAPAAAFQPSTRPVAKTALKNALRDMAAYPDDAKMMGEFEAFDRNGAYSRSPRGGMGGRMDMQGMQGGGYGMSMRGGNRDRMYTQDGFDPYSAYGGSSFGSQSDRRDPMGGMGGGYYGEPMMMGGMGMQGVKQDDTMGGFSYSSRVRGYGAGRPFEDMGFDGPMGYDGPMGGMGGMGGMDYEDYGPGGGYGGFDGDMSRMGP